MSCMCVEALELQDFVLSQSRARGIEAIMPAADGNYYYQENGDCSKIYKCAYRDKNKRELVFDAASIAGNSQTEFDGYEMCGGETKILLWNNSNSIYRYSFSADHYLYDVKAQPVVFPLVFWMKSSSPRARPRPVST